MLLTRRAPRKGLSLLEVILALAVFLLSVTGIVFLMGVASDQAIETQMRSQAMSLCQSRLAEVSSGAISLEGKGESACEDDDDYMWSMDVDSGSFNGLSNVTVHVSRKRANGSKFECSLSQMVLDPKAFGTVFDAAKDLSSSSTDGGSSSSSSDPSSGSSPSSSGAAAGGAAASPAAGKPSTPSTPTKTGGSTPSTSTTPKASSSSGTKGGTSTGKAGG